jgi:allantoicase
MIDSAASFTGLVDLAAAALGGRALGTSDDFFAEVGNLIAPGRGVFLEGKFTDRGKWMDGWETRRRRDQGHDYCVIQLAAPCKLALLDIDTRHFTGNYPPYASVQACRSEGLPDAKANWTDVLPYSSIKGNQRNYFKVDSGICTHLKLNIYPDGGIARLRAYGEVHREWTRAAGSDTIDLLAALNGGRALACNDEHYGSMWNLLFPGRGTSMADGWETRRRREPGFDWVILCLGHPGRIHHVEIDTAHFKGNYPHQISINAASLAKVVDADLASQSLYWPLLLEPQRLEANHVVRFHSQVCDLGPISHVRVNIHPDGGLSRVRLFGTPDRT